jgi:hypothetical protein
MSIYGGSTGGLVLENNGTALPGAETLNFTNGTVSQSGSVVDYAGPTNSLTVVGAATYDNVNEIVFGTGLSATATGGPQSIVQSAIFQEGGTCQLPNPVTIGNYIIVMALNNSISSTTGPGSTFDGLPLLQKTTQSAVNLCFIYGGVATSTVSPSVSYDSSVNICEVSGVVGVVSALTELTDSSNLYSFEPSGNAPENLLFFISTSSNNFNSGVSDILPSPSATGINTGSFGGFTKGGFSAYVTNVQSGNSVSFFDDTDEFTQVIYAVLNGVASSTVNVSYEPGPAFSVYQSTAQTFAASTFTLLEFQAVEYDTGNSFSSSTYQYKPSVAGYYQINASMSLNASDGEPAVIIISIFKNGTEYKRGVQTYSFQEQIIVSSLVEMNGTTDEISIYAYVAAAATTTAGSIETYFNGVMVRPA